MTLLDVLVAAVIFLAFAVLTPLALLLWLEVWKHK
jgi:hypothetical protein